MARGGRREGRAGCAAAAAHVGSRGPRIPRCIPLPASGCRGTPAREGAGVKPGTAMKTQSLAAAREQERGGLAEKSLRQQVRREPPTRPTRPGSDAGLNPGNPPRAGATLNRSPPVRALSGETGQLSSALPPQYSPCEVPALRVPGK